MPAEAGFNRNELFSFLKAEQSQIASRAPSNLPGHATNARPFQPYR